MRDDGCLLYLQPPLEQAVIAGDARTWRSAGEGGATPLVLLHGIGSNARSWAGQFAGLSAGRRVVAWNAPGYAGSVPLAADWPTPQAYAAALAALLDHLGIVSCILVGQSLGAIVAAAFTVAWPERVAALMLASPASGYGAAARDPLPANVMARVTEMESLGPAGLADKRAGRLVTPAASDQARHLVWQAMSEVTLAGYRQASRMLAAADILQDGPLIPVPTTVAWGSVDVITPPEGCRRVAASIPGARAVELPGLGHGFATEAPASFNAVVQSLLESSA